MGAWAVSELVPGFRDVECVGEENPDWDYARTLRAALLTPSAEWVQSVFSCPFESGGKQFIAPNRDFPYEGLLAHHEGEHWRFVDCVALGVQSHDGRWGRLLDTAPRSTVFVNPWCVTYRYYYLIRLPDGLPEEICVGVSYRLNSASPTGVTTGSIEFTLIGMPSHAHAEAALTVQPFVDLRHMYAGSDFHGYRVQFLNSVGGVRRVQIENYDRWLTFYLPPGDLQVFSRPELLHWHYKMGSGERGEEVDPVTDQAATRFLGEDGAAAAHFSLRPRFLPALWTARLLFACGGGGPCPQLTVMDIERIAQESCRQDAEKLARVQDCLKIEPGSPFYEAVAARVIGLTKFKSDLRLAAEQRSVRVPCAGAWWFRTPWFRDVFEGILGSFQTLMRFPEERAMIKDSILLALADQHPTSGLVPNRIPESEGQRPSYNSADATLLCLITACRYLAVAPEEALGLRVLDAAERMLDAFVANGVQRQTFADAPPCMDPATHLLLCVPHHSWIDTRCQCVDYAGRSISGLPNRPSVRFIKDLWQHVGRKERLAGLFALPRFFLPEINAQWITVLRLLDDLLRRLAASSAGVEERCLRLAGRVSTIMAQACACFRPVFWNAGKGFLYNLVYEDRKIHDHLECEAAVTAAAMLGETIFTPAELEAIWQHARSTLLIHRRLSRCGRGRAAFGLLTRREDRRIFYGDGEYHADVVWPRSTPYLIQLLKMLGRHEVVHELVVNALDHQMSEGAVFYNHELFSRPAGNNPCPDPHTHLNPVPVKNPIQFWSQWCDPVMEYFGKGEVDP
jgi:hypothetical protein